VPTWHEEHKKKFLLKHMLKKDKNFPAKSPIKNENKNESKNDENKEKEKDQERDQEKNQETVQEKEKDAAPKEKVQEKDQEKDPSPLTTEEIKSNDNEATTFSTVMQKSKDQTKEPDYTDFRLCIVEKYVGPDDGPNCSDTQALKVNKI
jgi:hypothetical protein